MAGLSLAVSILVFLWGRFFTGYIKDTIRNVQFQVGNTKIGDDTNDAPALHETDIGLALGIACAMFARWSLDIIVLDDNFASVVKVVR